MTLSTRIITQNSESCPTRTSKFNDVVDGIKEETGPQMTSSQKALTTFSTWHEQLPIYYDDAILFLQQQSHIQAVVITDKNCHICQVNQMWSTLCEYKLEEVVGRTFRFMQGPATDLRTLDILNDHITQGLPVEVLLNNYTKSGRIFRNFLQVKPLRARNTTGLGEITHFLGLLTDIDCKRR